MTNSNGLQPVELKDVVEGEVGAYAPELVMEQHGVLIPVHSKVRAYVDELVASCHATNFSSNNGYEPQFQWCRDMKFGQETVSIVHEGKQPYFSGREVKETAALVKELVDRALQAWIDRRNALASEGNGIEKSNGVLNGVVTKRWSDSCAVATGGRSFHVAIPKDLPDGFHVSLQSSVKIRPTGEQNGKKLDAVLVFDT